MSTRAKTLMERADELLNSLLDHDVGYEAQTGAAQIVDDLMAELQTLREERTAWRVTAENAEAAVKQARIDAQAQSCVPAVKATDQRVTFDTWLRSVCLQAPPDHAQDLARSAWYASDKQASADCEAMAEEIERLQKALAFWMPDVPSTDHPLYKRVANDVYLLVGFDGPNPEPSAFELGHVVLAESQPTLWAIHVPGPDDYYPSPSEEAANHMASKHNAAMTEWFKENPDTSGNRPPIESSMASAQRWPGSAEDHAEEIAVFDYAAWGLASPQPQPVQPSEPLAPANNYIQSVPDHCDRIVWRGHYHHLPIAQAKPEQAAQPFLNCTCFNETDRMYCTSKGKCSRIVAAAAPQPKD